MKKEILQLDIFDLKNALLKTELSSEAITAACIEQIKAQNDRLGAMLWLDFALAEEEARKSDERRKKGQALSPFDGIPIALKDMISSVDYPNTAASKILRGYRPPYDATVVKKLRSLGMVIIGKTNQDEFAMGSSNENSAYFPCKNPWNLEHSPGGSSGGSAVAVSAGMCFGALGTDTGGSIRQPASFCGLLGLKPSYGRVSRFGIIAFASSLDQVGPFAKSVKDAAAMLSMIAGYDSHDATSSQEAVPNYADNINTNVKGLRVGVPKEYFLDGMTASVRKAVEQGIRLLKERGAEIIDISLPHTKYAVATYYIIATAEASSNLSRYDGIRFGPRLGEDDGLLAVYEKTRGELFGPEVKRRILLGTYVLSAGYYDAYYLKAQKVRRLFANDFHEAFKKVDVIISPTAPTTAFKIGEKIADPLAMYLNDIYTISANLAGICALSLPCGLDEKGLPIGLQLMAKAFDEQKLFNSGAALEEELGFNVNGALV